MKKRPPKPRRKTGLPPGSLIHVGEIKTDHPSITLMEFDSDGLVERSFESIAESRAHVLTHQKLWLNVYGLQDAEILKEIGRRFHLHPLVLEDILNTHQRSKIEEYEDYLYCVVRLFDYDETSQTLHSDQLSLILGHNFVLTFQERHGGVFQPIRERLRTPHAPIRDHGPDYLAYALLDAVIDRYFVVVDHLGNAAELLEDQALEQPTPQLLKSINLVKHHNTQVRRAVWPLREVLSNLLRGENPFFEKETRLYLRDIYDHTIHVVETLDAVRDLLGDLMDIYLSSVSNRLNLEVRILTVLSMLFMPATLIAGIFGMNFHTMPLLERGDGFWLSLGMMGTFALLMAVIFWRRKLLRG